MRDKPLAQPVDCVTYLAAFPSKAEEVSDEEMRRREKWWREGAKEFARSDTARRLAAAERERESPEQQRAAALDLMLNSVGIVFFKCAWPTATYGRYALLEKPEFDADPSSKRASVAVVRLYGTSNLNGGPLWVNIVLEVSFRDGDATPIRVRFGDNNAVAAQPGTTLRSQFVRDLAPEMQRMIETICPNPP